MLPLAGRGRAPAWSCYRCRGAPGHPNSHFSGSSAPAAAAGHRGLRACARGAASLFPGTRRLVFPPARDERPLSFTIGCWGCPCCTERTAGRIRVPPFQGLYCLRGPCAGCAPHRGVLGAARVGPSAHGVSLSSGVSTIRLFCGLVCQVSSKNAEDWSIVRIVFNLQCFSITFHFTVYTIT